MQTIANLAAQSTLIPHIVETFPSKKQSARASGETGRTRGKMLLVIDEV